MATIIQGGSVSAPTSGGLFQGMKFWLSHRVPQRDRFVRDIQANGGKIVTIERDANVCLIDHRYPAEDNGKYSYQYVEKSLNRGKLENLEDHLVEPKRVIVGSRKKTGRTPFTPEDDEILLESLSWAGVKPGGLEIYRQIAAEHPHHTMHGWRGRWMDHLSHEHDKVDELSRRRERREALSQHLSGPEKEREKYTRMKAAKQEAKASGVSSKKEGEQFTEGDDGILNLMAKEILDAVDSSGEMQVYEKIHKKWPHHTANQWRARFMGEVHPEMVKDNKGSASKAKKSEKIPAPAQDSAQDKPSYNDGFVGPSGSKHGRVEAAKEDSQECLLVRSDGNDTKAANKREQPLYVGSESSPPPVGKTRQKDKTVETDTARSLGPVRKASGRFPMRTNDGSSENKKPKPQGKPQIPANPTSGGGTKSCSPVETPLVAMPLSSEKSIAKWSEEVSKHSQKSSSEPPSSPPHTPLRNTENPHHQKRKRKHVGEDNEEGKPVTRSREIPSTPEAEAPRKNPASPLPKRTISPELPASSAHSSPNQPKEKNGGTNEGKKEGKNEGKGKGKEKEQTKVKQEPHQTPPPPLFKENLSKKQRRISYQEMSTQAIYAEETDTRSFMEEMSFGIPGLSSPPPPASKNHKPPQAASTSASASAPAATEKISSPKKTDPSGVDSMNAYLSDLERKFKASAEKVIYAVERAGGKKKLVETILENFKDGKGLPEDVKGIWSEEEDKVLVGGGGREIMELEKKKGKESVEERMEWLNSWNMA